MTALIQLLGVFSMLSLLAFGGINALLPEIQRVVVENHHWMSNIQFAQLFAIAQASPGPNMMVIALVGLHVAGIAGAFAATIAICAPSSVLVYFFALYWEKFRDNPWRSVVQWGVTPLAVGLVLSSGWQMARAADTNWQAFLLTGLTIPVVLYGRIHPLWLIAAGAALGLVGVV